MTTLTAQQFVDKWGQTNLIQFNEIQSAQTHFNDLCALVGHPDPVAFGDPEIFNFEVTNVKPDGRKGRADVFYRSRFIWEYKGRHADLDKAYQQLLFYKDALDNPPLLITSDTKRIIIHTNFTNTIKQTHVITLHNIEQGNLRLLKTIFNGSLAELEAEFKPKKTREAMTQATAEQFINIVEGVRRHVKGQNLHFDSEEQAHFFIRLLFCLFSESIGLLPNKLFTQLMSQPAHTAEDIKIFIEMLSNLFQSMRDGKPFGLYRIPHFDGGLFDNDFVPPSLPTSLVSDLLTACRYDWSELEPSIFGTLFERILDSSKRHQIGAHYTSKADIELIIEPVLMQPLREEWQTIKAKAMSLIHGQEPEAAARMLQTFADKIAATTVLDPACGSGNFLYIALQHLLDLQKEVLVFAERYELPSIPLTVDPNQLHGMEINVYAHELAQVTVWIGYIQWRMQNGFKQFRSPILRPLETIRRMDAILAYDEQGQPVDPPWPAADVVIGNPPFLGSQRMRKELGDSYVDGLLKAYQNRIEGMPDLVCYWFNKSQEMLSKNMVKTIGLLATQAIRGGTNRQVLERIVKENRIFMAWSDKEWILDGATVHISLVGFDNGNGRKIMLDGKEVIYINADLTTGVNLIEATQLTENTEISFMGDIKVGPFDIDQTVAQAMLQDSTNLHGKSNKDVIRPWINATDITRRPRNMWIIDFGTEMSKEEASQYRLPFEYVKKNVKPMRQGNRMKSREKYWWIHGDAAPRIRQAFKGLARFIATPRVSKHRLFVWLDVSILPDNAVIVFSREDDYFFGVLHSTLHELWARRMGTQLRDAVSGFRYTPTTCFQTFPFPWPPGTEPSEAANETVKRIAELGRQLVQFRQGWLHPEEPLLGDAVIKKRTLTNLYNALEQYRAVKPGTETAWAATVKQTISLGTIAAETYLSLAEIERLAWLHAELDRAVLAAYGWPPTLSEEQILEKLLALNLARSA